MSQLNVDQTIIKYGNYVNDVLKEDLRLFERLLQEINEEISDLIQLKHTLKVITDKKIHPSGFKTQMNIGCNFFMEASVTDTSLLLFNIGLNHYLEFSIEEADKYLDVRIKEYEKKSEDLRDKSAKTKGHIKLMLVGIAGLQNKRNKLT